MIYLFPNIHTCTVNFYIKKRAWNTLDNQYAHDRGLCLWRQIIPICKFIWRSAPNAKKYKCHGQWFLDWKDKSVFEKAGRL